MLRSRAKGANKILVIRIKKNCRHHYSIPFVLSDKFDHHPLADTFQVKTFNSTKGYIKKTKLTYNIYCPIVLDTIYLSHVCYLSSHSVNTFYDIWVAQEQNLATTKKKKSLDFSPGGQESNHKNSHLKTMYMVIYLSTVLVVNQAALLLSSGLRIIE